MSCPGFTHCAHVHASNVYGNCSGSLEQNRTRIVTEVFADNVLDGRRTAELAAPAVTSSVPDTARKWASTCERQATFTGRTRQAHIRGILHR